MPRWILGVLLALGALRVLIYLIYVRYHFDFQFDTYHLEAKMVLLAYRAQAGIGLYPDWRDYPHVANFFGPVYFLIVGMLGKVRAGDLRTLYLIGRSLSFAAGLATSAVVGVVLHRRWGRGAAAGVLMSLGSLPMYGFSVMVRPDMLAEFLGVLGFFLSGARGPRRRVAGAAALVLAILTKQTAAVFLLAAVLALLLEGRRWAALGLSAGCGAAVAGIVAAVDGLVEPRFAQSLAGESLSSWSVSDWLDPWWRVAGRSADLLVLAIAGLILWTSARPREPRLAAFAAVVLAASLTLSFKHGSDLNYYLSLRVVEGLAAGTLWHATGAGSPRRLRVASAAFAAIGSLALLPGFLFEGANSYQVWRDAGVRRLGGYRNVTNTYENVSRVLRSPKSRVLTDLGYLDIQRKERAEFGDPWLFRTLVENGRIHPTKMLRWIDTQAYDWVITANDINTPGYAGDAFGLPMLLVERVRRHYDLIALKDGLFIYVRRPEGRGDRSLAAPPAIP